MFDSSYAKGVKTMFVAAGALIFVVGLVLGAVIF